MTGEPYGAKGCTCWAEPKASDHNDIYWAPNSACRFHGVLAEFLPPRTDTGVYRIVRADGGGKATGLEPLDLPGVDLSAAHREDRGCDHTDWSGHEVQQLPDGTLYRRSCEPADFHEAYHRYFCPTSGEYESSCHGGFDVCCDRPDLHRDHDTEALTYVPQELYDRLRREIEQAEAGDDLRDGCGYLQEGRDCPNGHGLSEHDHVPNEGGEPVCVPGPVWTHDHPPLIHQVKEPLTEEEAKTITEALRDPNRPKVVLPPRPASAESVEWLRQRGVGEPEGGFTQEMANALVKAFADGEEVQRDEARPERCVDCGSTDVVYHNYRDAPFCCPCAKCCDDTTGKDGRGIFAALRRWGRNTLNAVTNNGRGWL